MEFIYWHYVSSTPCRGCDLGGQGPQRDHVRAPALNKEVHVSANSEYVLSPTKIRQVVAWDSAPGGFGVIDPTDIYSRKRSHWHPATIAKQLI